MIKKKYLHAVKSIFDENTVFIGIRYSHLDEYVSKFDPIAAQQELDTYFLMGN